MNVYHFTKWSEDAGQTLFDHINSGYIGKSKMFFVSITKRQVS